MFVVVCDLLTPTFLLLFLTVVLGIGLRQTVSGWRPAFNEALSLSVRAPGACPCACIDPANLLRYPQPVLCRSQSEIVRATCSRKQSQSCREGVLAAPPRHATNVWSFGPLLSSQAFLRFAIRARLVSV
ncbi:unnamed protein product [Effrenium voratum]|nr:unnamed protein product [Effrenium voratum]